MADGKINALADLQGLPFTTKADLKGNSEAMISRERFYLLTNKTTGSSTGEPVTIPKTRDAMAQELAATWRGYSWAGIDIGDRQARFWGVPFGKKEKLRAKLIDFMANRKRCSAFRSMSATFMFIPRCLRNLSRRICMDTSQWSRSMRSIFRGTVQPLHLTLSV